MVSFDSSALIKCYQEEEHSSWVRDLMTTDPDWCGSVLLSAEGPIALAREFRENEDLTQVLPSECRFVTFDDRQRDAAEALGLKVLTPPV